ncbi:MAG: M15 family metallopeptidase [Candidatus Dojkabacteria bacterium]|nr:M15 family metallopeptidase [Candidatus Dojkabacteria bacterium]
MRRNETNKVLLICLFLGSIFAFWDILIFAGLQIPGNVEYLKKIISTQEGDVISGNEGIFQEVVLDEVNPEVKLESNRFDTEEKKLDIKVSSNEDLKTGDFGDYLIIGNGGEGKYVVSLGDLIVGKNEITLMFEDTSGNSTYKEIEITRKSPYILGASTSERIWVNGDDLLAVVDQEYSLPAEYYPRDLVFISDYGVTGLAKGMLIRKVAATDLGRMNKDAKTLGFDLVVLSSYRSYATQVNTFNYWLSAVGKDAAEKRSAKAGHSEHQLGTAIDFTCSEVSLAGIDFAETKAGKWLAKNSYKYGFILSYPDGSEDITGYEHEAWHFRYIGIGDAEKVHSSGKILIEYLRETKI